MLTLTTRRKIGLARTVQKLVMGVRRLAGKGPQTTVMRGGICWRIDLREGIDFSIWLLGSFEPATVRTYARLLRQGDIVFDVGANIGAHTLKLAASVGPGGRVYAIEPTDYAFTKLRANAALNPELDARIVSIQAMLRESAGGPDPEPVYSSWPLDTLTGEHHPLHLGHLKSCHGARSTTFDDLVEGLRPARIDLVKIDIDGFECDMLRGAAKALQRYRPRIVMELSPYVLEERGASAAQLVAWLADMGYGIRDIDTGVALPLDGPRLEALIPRGGSRNILALPA